MKKIICHELPSCDHQMSAISIGLQDYYFAPETRMWYKIDSVDALIDAISASTDDDDTYTAWCIATSPKEITEATHIDVWHTLNGYRAAKGGAKTRID